MSVSIPFRAVTGFEPEELAAWIDEWKAGFNPFQGCHWV